MTSQAVHDFCNAARESDALRAQRKIETRQATDARRAAEQILISTLGPGSKAQIEVEDERYMIRVDNKETYPTCGSSVVNRISTLWKDLHALRGKIEHSDREDIIEACTTLLVNETGLATQRKLVLNVRPLKGAKSEGDLSTLEGTHADVASALIRAKSELAKGREEHREELKTCTQRGQEAEKNIISELSQLEAGQVKRVNMVDGDGTTTSYYLRLKKARQPPKRKITMRLLQRSIRSVLNASLNPLLLSESMDKFCSASFAEVFIKDLKGALEKHEEPRAGADPPDQLPRVALDKLRSNRA